VDLAVRMGPMAEVVRAEPVGVRVEHPERIGVPEREQELPHCLADGVAAEPVSGPGMLGGEVVPAQRVRAVEVDHLGRLHHIAATLRHLLALGVEDQAEADAVEVAGAVEEQRRDRVQGVEPPPRLVDRLADVVGREAVLEVLCPLERVMELGEGHRAGVEPGVDRGRGAAHGALAALRLAGPGERVDVGAVQVAGDLDSLLAQVGDRAGAEALLAPG
jgi:hypothetical protein